MRKITKSLLSGLLALVMVFCLIPCLKTQAATTTTTSSLNRTKTCVSVGEKLTLSLSNASGITWKSSDKSVATVNKNGVVKGIAAGNATITATANNKKYTCKITVREKTPVALNLNGVGRVNLKWDKAYLGTTTVKNAHGKQPLYFYSNANHAYSLAKQIIKKKVDSKNYGRTFGVVLYSQMEDDILDAYATYTEKDSYDFGLDKMTKAYNLQANGFAVTKSEAEQWYKYTIYCYFGSSGKDFEQCKKLAKKYANNISKKASGDCDKIYQAGMLFKNIHYNKSNSYEYQGVDSCFLGKETVCAGVAKSIGLVLHYMNIENLVVECPGHQYLYVNYKNKWYAVECTSFLDGASKVRMLFGTDFMTKKIKAKYKITTYTINGQNLNALEVYNTDIKLQKKSTKEFVAAYYASSKSWAQNMIAKNKFSAITML